MNLVCLSILMLALVAKLVAMALAGASVMPAAVIIPVFWLAALAGATTLVRGVASGAQAITGGVSAVPAACGTAADRP